MCVGLKIIIIEISRSDYTRAGALSAMAAEIAKNQKRMVVGGRLVGADFRGR